MLTDVQLSGNFDVINMNCIANKVHLSGTFTSHYLHVDVTSKTNLMNLLKLQMLNSQLTDLRLTFEEVIVSGSSFAEAKTIFMQMKKVQKDISSEKASFMFGSPNADVNSINSNSEQEP
jgi:hypothetical protein